MSSKLPSSVRKGLSADEVLKMRGRSKADATAPSKVVSVGPVNKVGEAGFFIDASADPDGMIVEWYYKDIILEMRRRGKQYRVAEVYHRSG